jgi:hypothetical protein
VFAWLGSTVVARGDAIIAPGGLADVSGNSNNIAPFNSWSPARMQQVYAASSFGNGSGPEYIRAIAFRSAEQFGESIPDVTVALSTTNRGPDQLSPTFADNTGPDASVVYQGTLPIFSTDPTTADASHPRAFDVVINLQKPFLYDPSKGNLLLDITNPLATPPTFVNAQTPNFDAQEVLGDSVSRVLGYVDPHPVANNGYAVSDLSHGQADTLGLVTEFVTGGPDPLPQPGLPQVVPEPTTAAVLVLGSWLIFRGRGRRAPRLTSPARPSQPRRGR